MSPEVYIFQGSFLIYAPIEIAKSKRTNLKGQVFIIFENTIKKGDFMDYLNKSAEELTHELQELKEKFDALKVSFDTEVQDRKEIEFNLVERLKELNCHNRVAELTSNADLSTNEVLERIVPILAESMRFSDISTVSITIHNKKFQTPNFKRSQHLFYQEIKANNIVIGQIKIGYSEYLSNLSGDIFLPEEINLVDSLAIKIGEFILKKEKEIALIKSEGRYQKLVESINEAIYEISIDGTIIYISPAIEDMLGYTVEELTGTNIFAYLYSGDKPMILKALQDLGDNPFSYLEYRYITKDGSICWIRSSTNPIYENHKKIGGRGTYRVAYAP